MQFLSVALPLPSSIKISEIRRWNRILNEISIPFSNINSLNATARKKIKWRDLLPCGVFVFIQNCSILRIYRENAIRSLFLSIGYKDKMKILPSSFIHLQTNFQNWGDLYFSVSPRDKPSFYPLTKPTFKLCFLCGVVKTCPPWNFIAFLNPKCWWE